MSDGNDFGRLVEHLRRARGWSRGELGTRAGLSENTVGNIEKGRSGRPRQDSVRLLADAFGLSGEERERFLALARGAVAPAPAGHNLPHAPSTFVGRGAELAALRELLPTTRLLTLVGTGGCGKTRLARELAWSLVDAALGGIWWVDLASVGDAEGIARATLAAVGARPAEARSPREALLAWVATRAPLLILDNCEHLARECAALVGALLAASPGARVLVTSRRPLGLAFECVRPVPPLSLPAEGATTAAAVGACEAIQLLVARAGPSFALTDQNAAAAATLCRRLDGLPLALELAAARLRALDVSALVARLDGHFALLGSLNGSELARQQTMRAVLDWSYDSLSAAERALLQHLTPFVGGFTLAAAEAVGRDLAGAATPAAGTVPGLLASLVEQSLVVAGGAPGGARRYQLLETIRAYAREQLREAGAAASGDAGHCAWFTSLAARVPYPSDGGAEAAAWLDDLAPEVENLRAALAWARDHDPEAGLRLIGVVWPYWVLRLSYAEGRAWLETFLGRAGGTPAHRAAALHGLGHLSLFDRLPAARIALAEALARAEEAGDGDRAVAVRWLLAFADLASNDAGAAAGQVAAGWAIVEHDEGARRRTPYRLMRALLALDAGDLAGGQEELRAVEAAARALDQPLYRCIALARLGGAYLKGGDLALTIATYATLLEVADRLGCWFYRYIGRNRLALAREWSGDLDGARAEYDAALALSVTAGGSRLEQAVAALAQGRLALYRGEPRRALAPLETCAALLERLEHPPISGDLAYQLGLALWHTGQERRARARLAAALDLWVNDPARLALRLEGLAGLAASRGAATPAARWLAAADALRERTGIGRSPVDRPAYDAAHAAIAAHLDPEARRAAAGEGRARPLAAIIAQAREWLAAP